MRLLHDVRCACVTQVDVWAAIVLGSTVDSCYFFSCSLMTTIDCLLRPPWKWGLTARVLHVDHPRVQLNSVSCPDLTLLSVGRGLPHFERVLTRAVSLSAVTQLRAEPYVG